nr:MAG TPA: hypothetical protein [Caudoviricetes sp.]
MTRKELLDKAAECVCGQREQDYGTPEDSFKLIADLWTPYLRAKCVSHDAYVNILPEDVAAMMALLKVARIAGPTPTADSFVDLAGYAACAAECWSDGWGEAF